MAVVEMRLSARHAVQINSTWPVGNDSVCSVYDGRGVSECQTQCRAREKGCDGLEREKKLCRPR